MEAGAAGLLGAHVLAEGSPEVGVVIILAHRVVEDLALVKAFKTLSVRMKNCNIFGRNTIDGQFKINI